MLHSSAPNAQEGAALPPPDAQEGAALPLLPPCAPAPLPGAEGDDDTPCAALPPAVTAGLSALSLGSAFGAAMAARFLARAPPAHLPHVLPYLAALGSGERARVASAHERACPEVLPGLATPGWVVTAATDRAALPPQLRFIAALEAAFPAIRSEFLALRGAGEFQEYRAPAAGSGGGGGGGGGALGAAATDAGQWSVAYLQLHNATAAEGVGGALARCPATAAALAAVPRAYGHAFFSVLQPGSHIAPHCGPTNKKVRVHLPLVVPAGEGAARLRVGARTLALQEGACVAFQDSWEHEAWLDAGASSTRATLVVDVWHPLLTEAEVKVLRFLRGSAMRGGKAASDAGSSGLPQADDFYCVLRSARERARASDEAVFGGCPVVDD